VVGSADTTDVTVVCSSAPLSSQIFGVITSASCNQGGATTTGVIGGPVGTEAAAGADVPSFIGRSAVFITGGPSSCGGWSALPYFTNGVPICVRQSGEPYSTEISFFTTFIYSNSNFPIPAAIPSLAFNNTATYPGCRPGAPYLNFNGTSFGPIQYCSSVALETVINCGS